MTIILINVDEISGGGFWKDHCAHWVIKEEVMLPQQKYWTLSPRNIKKNYHTKTQGDTCVSMFSTYIKIDREFDRPAYYWYNYVNRSTTSNM